MIGNYRNTILVCSSLLAFVLIPLVLSEYQLGLVIRALMLAILAMSVNLLLGYVGLASVGHAAFFGTAAYAVALAAMNIEGAVWVAMGIAMLSALLMGAIFGLLAMRTRGIFFLVIMLALCQVVWGLAFSWRSLTGGDDGLPGLSRPEIFPGLILFTTQSYYIFVVLVFLAVTMGFWFLVNSPFGLTLKGIRGSETRMMALGYNVWLHKYIAFIISACISGIAGVLYAYYDGAPNTSNLTLIRSSTALLMVILGGPGTLTGPVLGSFIIVFLEDLVSGITERWLVILGLVYVAAVLFFPRGLLRVLRKPFLFRRGYKEK